MKIDIVTIFSDFFHGPMDYGIIRRAREAGLVTIEVHDLRAFAHDKHRTVDDRPFGGGEGMVLKPEPIFECIESLNVLPLEQRCEAKQNVVLLSAQGKRFDQQVAWELAKLERMVLICGRYEGVDERVGEYLADCELSIGDYVLSGGELPALVILDAVARLVPGVVGDEQSVAEDSFSRGLLDFPQFTRPAEIADLRVPDVLLSGNHAEIRRWRKREALTRTLERRPDLLAEASLDEEEEEILRELKRLRPERGAGG